ncbi:hypothetical protein SCHPADRAFT_353238 [Schizopora paradoxa]|uniref:Uncharacterized protein n=1 Tax=Schizopora paradoxa TaxID=27342 RepID=A0A0H2RW52_9AGAM|nr:hypothetical protein SCHPADRAFT_353238 [Schizopora paradoxa]
MLRKTFTVSRTRQSTHFQIHSALHRSRTTRWTVISAAIGTMSCAYSVLTKTYMMHGVQQDGGIFTDDIPIRTRIDTQTCLRNLTNLSSECTNDMRARAMYGMPMMGEARPWSTPCQSTPPPSVSILYTNVKHSHLQVTRTHKVYTGCVHRS